MVDENSGVDRNSVKLVDESSVVVENTGLKLEGLGGIQVLRHQRGGWVGWQNDDV